MDWERRAGKAVNHLLNRLAELTIVTDAKPDAGQRLLRFPIRHQMSLVASESEAEAETASTSNQTFAIKLGSATIGSVDFIAGNVTGAVTISAPILTAGSFLQVYAPNPQDTTLSGVSITLAVSR